MNLTCKKKVQFSKMFGIEHIAASFNIAYNLNVVSIETADDYVSVFSARAPPPSSIYLQFLFLFFISFQFNYIFLSLDSWPLLTTLYKSITMITPQNIRLQSLEVAIGVVLLLSSLLQIPSSFLLSMVCLLDSKIQFFFFMLFNRFRENLCLILNQ